MQQIGMAMLGHWKLTQRLPAAGVDELGDGPNLSWRVHLLPYIERRDLYEQFHLDEPWDSEHNRTLIDFMPEVYRSPNYVGEDNKTVYLAVTGPDTAFPGGRQGIGLGQVRDGTSKTLLVVEADPDGAVIWTKPDDWQFDPNDPRRGLGTLRPGGFLALFGDSHVAFISNDTDDETLRRLFIRNDGLPVELSDF